MPDQHHINYGRKQVNASRQGYRAAGSYRLREEGMDIVGQIEQRMGDDIPEGTHRTYRQAISSGRTNILRSRTAILGRPGGTTNSTEGKTRKGSQENVM